MAKRNYDASATIKKLVDSNPKRGSGKSYQRFAQYKDGMTVQQYIDACGKIGFGREYCWADLQWDEDRGFIRVSGSTRVPKTKPEPVEPVKEQLAKSLKTEAPKKPAKVTPPPKKTKVRA